MSGVTAQDPLCCEIEELLPAYLDGELSEGDHSRVQTHLPGCARCRATLRALRQVDRIAAGWTDPPVELRTRLTAVDTRMRRRLHPERPSPAGVIARLSRGLAASAAAVILILFLGALTLTLGSAALRTRTAEQTAAITPTSIPPSQWTPTPALGARGWHAAQLPNVVEITVGTYRKTAFNTVSDPAKITPVLDALANAQLVQIDPGPPGMFDPSYLVQLKLKDGTSLDLLYVPGQTFAKILDQGTAWWDAPGIDAALAPLLPTPLFHDGHGWPVVRDDTIAPSYGWAPIGNYVDRGPRLSPDGSKLAYLPPDGSWKSPFDRVIVRDLAHGTERDLTPTIGRQYSGLAWSPDGRSLAFVSYQPNPNQAGPSELWRIYADGSDFRLLYRRDATRPDARGPSIGVAGWSADGRSILIGGTIFDGLGPLSEKEVSVDGSGASDMTTSTANPCGPDQTAAWNGGPAAHFTDNLCVAAPANGAGPTLVRRDPSGGSATTLARFPVGSHVAGASESPDGRWIVAWTQGATPDAEQLWVVRPDGSGARLVGGQSVHLVQGGDLLWSSAGRAYFVALPEFASNAEQGFLYELDAATGIAQIVTTDWRVWNILAVTSDARRVVVLRGSGAPSWEQAELHLVELAPPSGQPAPTPAPTLAPITRVTPGANGNPTLPPTPTPNGLAPGTRTLPDAVVSLAVDPSRDQTVYALLVSDQLFRSDDGCQTWQLLPLPHAAPLPSKPAGAGSADETVFTLPQRGVVVPTGKPDRVFVVDGQVLYRSEDRGTSWTAVDDGVYAWTVADSAGETLYAWHESGALGGSGETAATGLYRSIDGGATWQRSYLGPFPPTLDARQCPCNHEGISALLADPRDPKRLYAGTDYGLYQSADEGKTWAKADAGLPPTQRAYRWAPILAADPGGTIYAIDEVAPNPFTLQAELARRRPGESSWTVVGQSALARAADPSRGFHGIDTLAADPARGGRLYLGTTRGLLVSDDAGATWQAINPPGVGAVYRLVATHSTLYLWTDAGFRAWPTNGMVTP